MTSGRSVPTTARLSPVRRLAHDLEIGLAREHARRPSRTTGWSSTMRIRSGSRGTRRTAPAPIAGTRPTPPSAAGLGLDGQRPAAGDPLAHPGQAAPPGRADGATRLGRREADAVVAHVQRHDAPM